MHVKFLIHVVTLQLKLKYILKLVVLAVESYLQVPQLVNTKPLNYVTVIRTVLAVREY